jgi:hypothetical protein
VSIPERRVLECGEDAGRRFGGFVLHAMLPGMEKPGDAARGTPEGGNVTGDVPCDEIPRGSSSRGLYARLDLPILPTDWGV